MKKTQNDYTYATMHTQAGSRFLSVSFCFSRSRSLYVCIHIYVGTIHIYVGTHTFQQETLTVFHLHKNTPHVHTHKYTHKHTHKHAHTYACTHTHTCCMLAAIEHILPGEVCTHAASEGGKALKNIKLFGLLQKAGVHAKTKWGVSKWNDDEFKVRLHILIF